MAVIIRAFDMVSAKAGMLRTARRAVVKANFDIRVPPCELAKLMNPQPQTGALVRIRSGLFHKGTGKTKPSKANSAFDSLSCGRVHLKPAISSLAGALRGG